MTTTSPSFNRHNVCMTALVITCSFYPNKTHPCRKGYMAGEQNIYAPYRTSSVLSSVFLSLSIRWKLILYWQIPLFQDFFALSYRGNLTCYTTPENENSRSLQNIGSYVLDNHNSKYCTYFRKSSSTVNLFQYLIKLSTMP
jgi:hypothetical protein